MMRDSPGAKRPLRPSFETGGPSDGSLPLASFFKREDGHDLLRALATPKLKDSSRDGRLSFPTHTRLGPVCVFRQILHDFSYHTRIWSTVQTSTAMVRVKDALKQAKERPSAFETATVGRKRHPVLGHRQVGKTRTVLQSRARSDQIRRETLLIEHQQQGRTNAFVDGRFGEEDESMPIEDKLVQRFQRERTRQLRESRFSLADKPAAMELTHGGLALGDMEDLSDAGDYDSDNERGGDDFNSKDVVQSTHFGGGVLQGDERRKTAAELLEETIAKYKLKKYERQEAKAEENKVLKQLDTDFGDLRGLIFSTSKRAEQEQKGQVSKLQEARTSVDAHTDYESLARELGRDMRARPADRLKSDEELAVAEAERLRNLEAERLKRMRSDGGVAARRGPTDDDLVDDFEIDAPTPMVGGQMAEEFYGIDEHGNHTKGHGKDGEEEAVEEGEGEEAGGEEEDGEEEEQEEEAEDGEDDEDGGGGAVRADAQRPSSRVVGTNKPASDKGASRGEGKPLAEIPYVMECPTKMGELDDLMALAGPAVARQRQLLHNLIAGHNAKLKEANRGKLQVLLALLLRRMQALATSAEDFPSMQLLCPAMYSIAIQIPSEAARAVLDALRTARALWERGRSREEGSLTSLPPAALALIALCAQLYPVTDFRHTVLTPCVLFVAEVLHQPQPPQGGLQLRRTLFLCSCALQLVAPSRRCVPAAILSTPKASDGLATPDGI